MITISRSKRFEVENKKFVKRNTLRAESIIKGITLFVLNPQHPSLNVEKLIGSNVWSMRLSEGNRLFFLWLSKDEILLIDVGTHDKYKQY
ncbi:hypothetical protein COZ40_01345 [Candidatus Roizmanbacteria bacterium CG_4_10_14_3_um_filter_39_13]|uniref:Type II toxin-antitoxin system mRNA interferase toxin, RelE/StbE family n=2 Tax=Candidatus Roizmaniibacteriota TaxID=1752723 RepID=A0A2M7EKF8_9BACT|nr:MAG: hypothetical protein COW57_01775 [Candidatus Roizmanbacteria bacterium CG17_big_fil_post_rev_8_21_14_2_50_39_7]PIX68806.1 MAG: hypothetical protein COZ40_01345 [Candidatus Roizmanbacteria bacterium CG_4_10_14_3_um_filter_39_13]